jgi:uncharacterized protein YndB with AHSA1/START domain
VSKSFQRPHRPRNVLETHSNSQASRRTSLAVGDETAVYWFWKERIDRLEEYLNRKEPMSKSGAATGSIVVERELPYPPEKIWRALTEVSLIQEWLMDNDFQAEAGHKFQFWAAPAPHWNGVTDCEVLVVEPNKRLSYSWNSSGDEAATGLKTMVVWTLKPTKSGTFVRMEQSGFRPDQDANYQGAQHGWQRFFSGLERVAGGLG